MHWRFLLSLAVGTAGGGGVLAGQDPAREFRGVVVREADGLPVSGAFVVLLDDAGRTQQGVLTADDGTFVLHVSLPGSYRVRLQRIGFQTWTSEHRSFSDNAEVLRLEMPTHAIPLEEGQ